MTCFRKLRHISLMLALVACLTVLTVGCADKTPPDSTDPPESDKFVIQSFEEGEPVNQLTSLNWDDTSYGITNPLLTAAVTDTDLGHGLTVTLTENAICQSFTFQTEAVKAGFSDASSFKYLRLWVCNRTGNIVSIGIHIGDVTGGTAAFDGDKILACYCDGTEISLSRNDASGMGLGHNSAIAVPDGFEGWLSFPLTELRQNWSYEMLGNITQTDRITIDLRPTGYDPDGYYILDELVLANSIHGEKREASRKDSMITEEQKLAYIDEAFSKLQNTAPIVKEIPEFTPTMTGYTHIKAITYDGLDKNGEKTKVFAYIGFPEGATEENPVPAIVLLHGGGGHAFLEWVKMWNDRGYAAIAMDNTGCFPTAVNAGKSEATQGFAYGLSGIFTEDGYVNAPGNDGMGSSDGKIDGMWMYHAVGQVIIANNILRADKRVDSSKIGVTGISWGGVITSIAIGWDDRFAFAIPIYGSGYLTEARAWIKDNFAGSATQALWSAANRFDKVTMPVLWLGWNDDNCFSVNSHTASYADTVKLNGDTRLSYIHRMMHSHASGWKPAESMIFADSIVKGTPAMAGFATQPSGYDVNAKLNVDTGTVVSRARLFYITSPQTYSRHTKYGYTDTFMDQEWMIAPLTYDEATNTVTGEVPAEAAAYYIEVTNTIGEVTVVTCSEFIELG